MGGPLSDTAISTLLMLVKGIDQLLQKHDELVEQSGVVTSKWMEPRKTSSKNALGPAANRPKGNKPTIEFDLLSQPPKNFYHALLPLNDSGCPGLLETRKDFKVVQKKRK